MTVGDDSDGADRVASERSSALTRSNTGLFQEPAIREAIRAATGLTDADVDKISEGLAKIGAGVILPNGIDTQAKYANAIALVRDHGYSAYRAARQVGISTTHLQRRLNALGANGDLERQAAAGDRRILEMSQTMSLQAGEMLLDRMDDRGDAMKTTELQKIYTASTNQVAAKQRWAKEGSPADGGGGMSVIAQMLQGKKVTIEDHDRTTQETIDVGSRFVAPNPTRSSVLTDSIGDPQIAMAESSTSE